MFSAANDILPPLAPSLRPTPPPHPQHPNETPRNDKIRAPCMIRGVRAAKRAPPWQDLRAMHSRKAVCSAFRIHGARILPKPARFGYTAAISCQEGALFPSETTFGIHEAKKLPRIAARERTVALRSWGDTVQTKHLPIQHHTLTRPRNREIILVPSAKKRR